VEYALAGMDNELPKKEDMRNFIAQHMKEMGDGA